MDATIADINVTLRTIMHLASVVTSSTGTKFLGYRPFDNMYIVRQFAVIGTHSEPATMTFDQAFTCKQSSLNCYNYLTPQWKPDRLG